MATTNLILPEKLTSPPKLKHASVSASSLALADAALTAWLTNINNKFFGVIETPSLIFDPLTNQFTYKIYYIDYTPFDTPVTRIENNTPLSASPTFSS